MRKKLATRQEALAILLRYKSHCPIRQILIIIASKSTDEQWSEFISQSVHPNQGLEFPMIELQPEEAKILRVGKLLGSRDLHAVL